MRELFIENAALQTRVYVVEDGELVEFHREYEQDRQTMGSVYLGRVQRIISGMQAAFVDIGLDQNAFLPAGEAGGEPALPLQKRLKGGALLPVQVQRAPGGEKGVRVSTKIQLAGRLLVLLPGQNGISISKRIRSQAKRDAIKTLLEGGLAPGAGVVVRSNAQQAEDEALMQELRALENTWQRVTAKAASQPSPGLLWEAQGLLGRMMTDLVDHHTTLYACGAAAQNALSGVAQQLCPSALPRILPLSPQQAMQRLSALDQQLGKLTQRRVWLKSGGTLVVDQTEALWVMDVNTAKFVGGKQSGDEVLMHTNEEAVAEAARQLRLRDMEGMVLIDLIHLPQPRQQALLTLMQKAVQADRGQIHLHGFSAMGLLELTRRRPHRQAPDQAVTACPYCGGSGAIAAQGGPAQDALLKAWRMLAAQPGSGLMMILHPTEAAIAHQALQNGALKGVAGRIALKPSGKHRGYQQIQPAADEQMQGLQIHTLA